MVAIQIVLRIFLSRFYRLIVLTPLTIAASLLTVTHAQAVEQSTLPLSEINATELSLELQSQNQPNYVAVKKAEAMAQVTSVSQLSDVRPTDWAFQALQSLVERYGCIAGYPDRTYRGDRALTRYEFAAGLNACLDRINELIAAATADLVKKEDLATLQKLQSEFATELATLLLRVDAIETRTSTLEQQQFSTTTKLTGEAIFAVATAFQEGNDANNTVFQDRIRLYLNTSFTGNDLFLTRLTAGNANNFNFDVPGTPGGSNFQGLQQFSVGNTGGNSLYVDWIGYYLPLGDKGTLYIAPFGGSHFDYAPTLNPFLDGGLNEIGVLSLFAQRNPIYAIGGGSGLGVTYNITPALTINAGYLADNSDAAGAIVTSANNPSAQNGLFNGNYSALSQLTLKASDTLSFALTYVNAYRISAVFDFGAGLSGFVGTLAANQSPGITPAKVNSYGATFSWQTNPQFLVNGFFSYTNADFLNDGEGSRNIWSYGLGIGLPDFGKQGNLLGIVAGVEPYLGNPTATQRASGVQNDLPLHFEAFYRHQLNDNISITPGVIWLVNPGQNQNNNDAVIGAIRTTFLF